MSIALYWSNSAYLKFECKIVVEEKNDGGRSDKSENRVNEVYINEEGELKTKMEPKLENDG